MAKRKTTRDNIMVNISGREATLQCCTLKDGTVGIVAIFKFSPAEALELADCMIDSARECSEEGDE